MPDIGELVVGAWLTQVEGYDFVVYNQRPGRDLPASIAPAGLAGVSARLGELDVIGLHTSRRESYLAECTTHLDGVLYGSGVDNTVVKLQNKFRISSAYADQMKQWTGLKPKLAFWTPKVSEQVIDRFAGISESIARPIEVVANDTYRARVDQLLESARKHTTATGNDFYRTLQLLTHLSRATTSKPKPAAEMAAPVEHIVLPWSEVVKVHRTQAGIRAPRNGTEASIICNTGPHGPYPDRFLTPDVLHYVGRELEGDQEIDRDNESLRLAIERKVPVRVFEKIAKNQFVDHGFWEGVGEPLYHLDAVATAGSSSSRSSVWRR